jgi:hypothetical protein
MAIKESNMKSAFVALAITLLFGCGNKEVKTAEELKAVLDKPNAAGATLKAAPPELQGLVDTAVTAMQKDDQVTAVMTLRQLRTAPNLSDEQHKAIQDMMSRSYDAVVARAARGDPQAKAQLQIMQMNPR